jgi:hypothetical protein
MDLYFFCYLDDVIIGYGSLARNAKVFWNTTTLGRIGLLIHLVLLTFLDFYSIVKECLIVSILFWSQWNKKNCFWYYTGDTNSMLCFLSWLLYYRCRTKLVYAFFGCRYVTNTIMEHNIFIYLSVRIVLSLCENIFNSEYETKVVLFVSTIPRWWRHSRLYLKGSIPILFGVHYY